MLIQPIDYFLLVWLTLAACSAAYVGWDQYRHNPEPTVMKWGFILVTLYMGPLGLLLYVLADKEPRPALTESSITVETVQHKQVTVLLDPSTKFTHSDTQATVKDLKVGDRVVIHAKSNPEKKLVGVTVKWGANATAHPDHADTK